MRKAYARKFDTLTVEVPQRDPDMFDVYVYNDFAGYGYQEVVENNMVEFIKCFSSKDGKTEELWRIVSGMAMWLLDEPNVPWHNGERFVYTCSLLGYMFLAALNRIDRDGEFKVDSKYKDLSLVMALWAVAAFDLGTDVDDPFMTKKRTRRQVRQLQGLEPPLVLLALSKESGVPIKGVTSIDDKIEGFISAIDGKVKLPPKKEDRFTWKAKVSSVPCCVFLKYHF